LSDRLGALAIAAALAAGLTGCASAEPWWKDRLLDAADVFDVKHGFAVGVGAKVEATLYLGVGVGFAALGPDVHESYGRQGVDADKGGSYPGRGTFVHMLLGGFDGYPARGGDPTTEAWNVIGLNLPMLEGHSQPKTIDTFRFGAEVIPGIIVVGLYLNAGQLADFLGGLVGFDPAGDDEKPEAPRVPHSPHTSSASAASLVRPAEAAAYALPPTAARGGPA
jgi:hypothetical protein